MSHPIQTAFKGGGAIGGALFAVISPELSSLSEEARVIGAIVAVCGSIAFTASMCLDVVKKAMAIRKEMFQARAKADVQIATARAVKATNAATTAKAATQPLTPPQ